MAQTRTLLQAKRMCSRTHKRGRGKSHVPFVLKETTREIETPCFPASSRAVYVLAMSRKYPFSMINNTRYVLKNNVAVAIAAHSSFNKVIRGTGFVTTCHVAPKRYDAKQETALYWVPFRWTTTTVRQSHSWGEGNSNQ